MEDNKISVIIPAYNLEAYLERAVKSVLQQTYTNIEVLIVDDGSTDNSWKVIQRIAASDNRVIPIKQENNGVTSARINGIRHATGQWIGFVDGDDEIEPDMYQILLSNAEKYHADISHCGYQMIFGNGRIHYFYGTGNIRIQDNLKGVMDLLEGKIIEPGLCNKIFKKTLFEEILKQNVIPEKITINEDLLMNYYLFSVAKSSVFMDVCKYHYLVRKDSVTRTELNHNRIYDPIEVKKIICEDVPGILQSCAEKAYLNTCVNVYNSLVLAEQKKYKKDLESIRKIIKKNREKINLLNRKQQLLALLILHIPSIYKVLYRYYAKYLMQNKYE